MCANKWQINPFHIEPFIYQRTTLKYLLQSIFKSNITENISLSLLTHKLFTVVCMFQDILVFISRNAYIVVFGRKENQTPMFEKNFLKFGFMELLSTNIYIGRFYGTFYFYYNVQ